MKKIGVLIESHYDETEFNLFNEAFTRDGYELDYLSYLWGQPSLTFTGNDNSSQVTVDKCVTQVSASDYAGIILIGGYATDRLRYQENITPGQPNASPAVEFLRKVLGDERVKIGTICHSLWLLCADNTLLEGRRVTCAHNIVCDVENAGGIVEFDGAQTKDIVTDGNLISAKHPGVTELFIRVFKDALR